MQLLIACSLAHVGNTSGAFDMQDIESVVAGLKTVRDEIYSIDERSVVAQLVGLALHEALRWPGKASGAIPMKSAGRRVSSGFMRSCRKTERFRLS